MGSRSKQLRRAKADRVVLAEQKGAEFLKNVLGLINRVLAGARLTWDERAALMTKLPGMLPSLCKRHDVSNRLEGFIMVSQRLSRREPLEFFDRDLVTRLVKLLNTVMRSNPFYSQVSTFAAKELAVCWPSTTKAVEVP
jgi:hypothetical protein